MICYQLMSRSELILLFVWRKGTMPSDEDIVAAIAGDESGVEVDKDVVTISVGCSKICKGIKSLYSTTKRKKT